MLHINRIDEMSTQPISTEELLAQVKEICTVEELCEMVGSTLEDQEIAQLKIERH